MATTALGAALTERHRLIQARLSAQTVGQLLGTWQRLDPLAIDRSLDAWLAASTTVVARQRARSEAIASAYQRQFRNAELGATAPLGDGLPLDLEALRSSITIQGPVRLKALVAAGGTIESASGTAARSAAAVGARHTLEGGRAIIDTSTAADPDAHGARRVTSVGCCAFCAMLAARSYSGLSAAHFRAHDNCHCQPETAYATGPQDATRQAREFAALYDEATAGVGGGGSNKLNAFRRALAAQRRA